MFRKLGKLTDQMNRTPYGQASLSAQKRYQFGNKKQHSCFPDLENIPKRHSRAITFQQAEVAVTDATVWAIFAATLILKAASSRT